MGSRESARLRIAPGVGGITPDDKPCETEQWEPRYDGAAMIRLTVTALVVIRAAQAALQQDPCDPPRLVLHFKDPHFEAEAERAIAEVWQLAARCMDLSEAKRGKIHVYNDVVANQAIAAEHGHEASQSSPGFVLDEANAAHVLFWRCGWCRDARWRVGALTMELALSQASPLPRDQWPRWFTNGLGSLAEGPHLSDKGWIEARRHADRGPRAPQAVRQMHGLPSMSDILSERAIGLRPERAAAVGRLAFRFLLEQHGDELAAAMRAATARGTPHEACEAAYLTLAEATADAWTTIDERFATFVDGLPATIDLEPYPAPDGQGAPGDADYVPLSPAIMWLDKNGKSKFTLTARPQLVQVGQGDLAFERTRGRWVRVTLVASLEGTGHVVVSERAMSQNRPTGWTVLAASTDDVAGVRLGREIEFELIAERKRLSVFIDGKLAVSAAWKGGSLSGRYGVGGPFGNQVAWRGVRLK